ncbi:MAG: 3-deoxy-D-manno-octulosonic acid transferase, partial [Caulobacter sp.]|nr:3-deoxy-D-manno-octulosonic acid transferase [Caulobacter sp.]
MAGLGEASRARPDGRLVWVHAASVGESLSVLPVVGRLVAEGLAVMVTTGTTTSAALMAERLPDGAFHQFVPVDRARFVARFLDHWRPDFAVWVESEFWPVMLEETARRGIPMA